jgi:hypothetical protein
MAVVSVLLEDKSRALALSQGELRYSRAIDDIQGALGAQRKRPIVIQ